MWHSMSINPYDLPYTLDVNGKQRSIRTDYRDILTIIKALNDPDLDEAAKAYVLLNILYTDTIPEPDMEKAIRVGFSFISAGIPDDGKPKPKLMDWEQDAPQIIPAINRVAGTEVRALKHLHWWTFLGYYMEIGESQFSNIVSIRAKKAKGKKLEKYEQEFYQENRAIIDLKVKQATEERDALNALIGWTEEE